MELKACEIQGQGVAFSKVVRQSIRETKEQRQTTDQLLGQHAALLRRRRIRRPPSASGRAQKDNELNLSFV